MHYLLYSCRSKSKTRIWSTCPAASYACVSQYFPHCLQVPIIVPFLGIICIDFNSLPMKTHYCNCEKYCQGDWKEVSRSTFFRHEKLHTIFTPWFQEYLTCHPIVMPEPGPSGCLTNTGPFPQYNCMAQVEVVLPELDWPWVGLLSCNLSWIWLDQPCLTDW